MEEYELEYDAGARRSSQTNKLREGAIGDEERGPGARSRNEI